MNKINHSLLLNSLLLFKTTLNIEATDMMKKGYKIVKTCLNSKVCLTESFCTKKNVSKATVRKNVKRNRFH